MTIRPTQYANANSYTHANTHVYTHVIRMPIHIIPLRQSLTAHVRARVRGRGMRVLGWMALGLVPFVAEAVGCNDRVDQPAHWATVKLICHNPSAALGIGLTTHNSPSARARASLRAHLSHQR